MNNFNKVNLIERICNIHDIDCNQKYEGVLPYSFHLKAVAAQAKKYSFLLDIETSDIVEVAAIGHDLIEDARTSYNDIINLAASIGDLKLSKAELLANIIYSCTEFRGKNRKERHCDEFYKQLSENRLGVYVKLCDILANSLFSELTNSSMKYTYMKEFPTVFSCLYVKDEYECIWNDLKKLLS